MLCSLIFLAAEKHRRVVFIYLESGESGSWLEVRYLYSTGQYSIWCSGQPRLWRGVCEAFSFGLMQGCKSEKRYIK